MRHSLAPWPIKSLLAVIYCLLLGYVSWTLFGSREPNPLRDESLVTVILLASVLVVVLRASMKLPDRVAWAVLALGLFAWSFGNAIYVFYISYLDPVPFPSISDAFFLAMYPCVAVAVLMLARRNLDRAPLGAWFDGLLVALATAAYGWLVISSIVSEGTGSTTAIVTNAAYPIADILLICVLVAIFGFFGGRPGPMWWCLAAGVILFALTDTLYLLQIANDTYAVGSPIDVGWAIGIVVIATSAWLAPPASNRRVDSSLAWIVPAAISVSAFGLLLYSTTQHSQDGQHIPVASVVLAAAALVAGAIGVLITRNQAVRKAESSLIQAQEAYRVKSQFLANMSHEIRTPMNGVLGMLELTAAGELSGSQREYVRVAQSSAQTMLAVLNDILDFSKLEAGKLRLERVAFDVREAVEDVTALYSNTVADKDLEIFCYFPPEVNSNVIGDPDRIRQILSNLVGNAVKFTSAGEVAVTVSQLERSETSVLLRFEVRDTGIGISEDAREQIFESFSQADASTTRRFGGTGLGLTITGQLVSLVGGTIDVSSDEARGSVFGVQIRFDREMGANPPTPIEGADQIRVLLVGDDNTSSVVIAGYLRSWNVPTRTASDVASALDEISDSVRENRPFDLVIVDRKLPGASTLPSAVEARSGFTGTRVAALSAKSGRADVETLDNDFDISIHRPVRQSVLRSVLVDLLAEPNDAASAAHANPAAQIEADAQTNRRQRVLLVEDNPINQLVALTMLRRLGYEANAVGNGLEALESLGQIPYDLVLMDCQMPEMDGFEATRQWRKRETGSRRLPIIALTAGAMEGDQQRCLEAGMDDYLAKPITLEQLSEKLSRFLG